MFKFAFEKLLEIYILQEEMARRDYLDSASKLQAEKDSLQNMYNLCDRSMDEIFELRNSPTGAPVERLSQIDTFMAGQKIKIERQKEVVMAHTKIVEQKQEILHSAAKERKILEKLKEKKQEEYKKLERKKEIKLTDELVVTRFKGRL